MTAMVDVRVDGLPARVMPQALVTLPDAMPRSAGGGEPLALGEGVFCLRPRRAKGFQLSLPGRGMVLMPKGLPVGLIQLPGRVLLLCLPSAGQHFDVASVAGVARSAA